MIGASAGGVEALSQLVSHLPHDLAAAVLVVLHIPQDRPSVLPRILSAAGALPATHAKGGERAVHGHLYVAPPGRHLLVHDGTLRLSSGPKEGGHRPAIDPLFRTAARAAGSRVVRACSASMGEIGTVMFFARGVAGCVIAGARTRSVISGPVCGADGIVSSSGAPQNLQNFVPATQCPWQRVQETSFAGAAPPGAMLTTGAPTI